MPIEKPHPDTYPAYYQPYIDAVPENDLLQALHNNQLAIDPLIKKIMGKEGYRYAEGKWSIKEVLTHVADAERVFAYRALTFARNDKAELPGFDENEYVKYSNADNRHIQYIYGDLMNVRSSSMILFSTLDADGLLRCGIANGNPVSVIALGYIIAGHANHHFKVIKERYL